MATRDFLVVYEEPDDDGLPVRDSLTLDIETAAAIPHGEMDVEQKVDIELANSASRAGTVGFSLSAIGAALGFVILLVFSLNSPQNWYDADGAIRGSPLVRTTIIAAVLVLLLMIIGVILTHYGRRIKAKGNLSQVRIVERSSQARAFLREEE
jgi:hypothetical protein